MKPYNHIASLQSSVNEIEESLASFESSVKEIEDRMADYEENLDEAVADIASDINEMRATLQTYQAEHDQFLKLAEVILSRLDGSYNPIHGA